MREASEMLFLALKKKRRGISRAINWMEDVRLSAEMTKDLVALEEEGAMFLKFDQTIGHASSPHLEKLAAFLSEMAVGKIRPGKAVIRWK